MIPEAVSQPFGKRPVHKHPLSVALLPFLPRVKRGACGKSRKSAHGEAQYSALSQ